MLDQLKELLEMQRVLDEAILKEHGNVYDEKIAEQMKIALFVELGELMNEMPTKFKHWKKTAEDNREAALVEYVDALHFQLSLFNYYECKVNKWIDYNNRLIEEHSLYDLLQASVKYANTPTGINRLFDIGNHLGFTWDEIYQAYKEKNEINYERLKNGY